jgi:hypothetical protein
MALAEYIVKDEYGNARTYQFDEKDVPKGAKKVGAAVTQDDQPAEPGVATAEEQQEPGNRLEETARGQANVADVKAAEKANKAAAKPDNK